MISRMALVLLAASFGTMCLSISPCVVADDPPEATTPADDLLTMCGKAKAEFRPLTEADVEKSKTVLLQALDQLDKRLDQAGSNGQDWRKYLEADTLREQLRRAEGPDRDALTKIHARYISGHEGLELVWFLDVHAALHNYLAMTGAVGNPAIRAAFEQKIDQLTERLKEYATGPTTDAALDISESIRWLQNAQQAPALVQAIQLHYVHPNLLGQISPEVLGAGIVEAVDETMSIRDCILGTDIYGTAHTVGETNVELAPDPRFGVIDALFFGTTTSDNVGYHGPVTIFSNATTRLAARKRLWIHAGGLASYPSNAKAVTDVDICDIQSNRGRAMIERMAWKRAGQQQGTAEYVASRHAEQRLNERIDQRAADSIDRANRAYIDKFYRPFTERKLFPQMLRFSTTERALSVVGLQAGGGKLGAPGDPPPTVEGADMSLRIHESTVNNLTFDALAGRTVYEEKLQATVTETLGHLPEKMKGDDDGKPWAITFAQRQPISVTFADDGLKITLRGVNFYKGKDIHPGMNVSATYKIEESADGFKAVRQGDIEVLPPDFEPGKQIDARRQIIRKLLEKRFAKVFEPEILGEGFELPGKWKAAGKMRPIQVVARDGWLVIAWKRSPVTPNTASAE